MYVDFIFNPREKARRVAIPVRLYAAGENINVAASGAFDWTLTVGLYGVLGVCTLDKKLCQILNARFQAVVDKDSGLLTISIAA